MQRNMNKSFCNLSGDSEIKRFFALPDDQESLMTISIFQIDLVSVFPAVCPQATRFLLKAELLIGWKKTD
jgi:hypothetical protein